MRISAEVTVQCKNETECGQVYNQELDARQSFVGHRYLPPVECRICRSKNIHIIELRVQEIQT